MGLLLTILYIVLTIISPEQFGPDWAGYHVLVYLAVITALFSLPNLLSRSSLLSSVQTYLLLAFIVAIALSQIANHWLGGAFQAWLQFLPSAAVFFFIVANVTTGRRLKIVIFASVAACLGLVAEAFCGYYIGFLGDTFVLKMHVDAAGGQVLEQLPRLRGVGFLNDPNDFSQILIIVLALLFVAWRRGRILSNTLFVLAPAAVLLWAVYLTHSRGALIGLAVLALMAGYKRIGKVPALVLSGLLGVGLMALDFTGGRAISAEAGVDRLSLWASGLEFFKSSPIFGIGFGNFADQAGHTAHNSFILPLAELGIIGATIFVALLVTTTLDLNRLIALREQPFAPAGPNHGAPKPPPGLPNGSPDQPRISDPASGLYSEPDPASLHDPALAAGIPAYTSGRTLDQTPDQTIEPYSAAELPERVPVGIARLDEEPTVGNLQHRRDDGAPEAMPATPEWFPPIDDAPAPVLEPQARAEPSADVVAQPVPDPVAPDNPVTVIRLALVSFMATGWFLSRTYNSTIYLVLGLAVAAVGLDPAAQARDHKRWISVTLAAEAFLIIFVYLVVRLRH